MGWGGDKRETREQCRLKWDLSRGSCGERACEMRRGERGRERERDWIDDGVRSWCVCVGGGARGLGGYCSVTLPVSAGGSSHQDIKYATMLTAASC